MSSRIAVIGGGISGLAAAHRLLTRGAGEVTVYEASDRVGGVIRSAQIAGRPVDLGADTLVTRSRDLMELVSEVGVADRLIEPAHGTTMIYSRGRLRPLPLGITQGMPDGIAPLLRSGLLSPLGVLRGSLDLLLPRTDPTTLDDNLGALIRARFGDEILEQVIDPLIGGINHARCDDLSLRVAGPQFESAARSHRSVLRGLRSQAKGARSAESDPGEPTPMFCAPPSGVSELIDALSERVQALGGEIRTASAVTSVGRGQATVAGGETIKANGTIVALRPGPAAQVLADSAPSAADGLGRIDQTSITQVILVYPSEANAAIPQSNGLLVPAREGGLVRSASWVTRKWPQRNGDGSLVVRCSVNPDSLPHRSPAAHVAAAVHEDLAGRVGTLPEPTADRVEHLQGALSLARPGHPVRMAAIRSALQEALPSVRLAGPHIAGSGIGACVSTAQEAADAVMDLVEAGR